MKPQIQNPTCKYCGCTKVAAFSQDLRHTNGDWNERVTLECGQKLHYVPNFRKVMSETGCSKNPNYFEASERAVAFQRRLAVHFKDEPLSVIRHVVTYREEILQAYLKIVEEENEQSGE